MRTIARTKKWRLYIGSYGDYYLDTRLGTYLVESLEKALEFIGNAEDYWEEI